MINKRTIFTSLSVSAALLLFVAWTAIGFSQTAIADVSFKGRTTKETYVLGEPVTVEFEFTNNGDNPIKVWGGGVLSGNLQIFIVGQDGEFKRYKASNWGRKKDQMVALEPGKSLKLREATMLWNGTPQHVSRLTEDAAKEYLEGKVTTEYAFQEPGIYFIKGVSSIGENGTPIESEPIKVIVEEPIGDDLEVWNQIKGSQQFAFILERGEVIQQDRTKRQKVTAQAEEILKQFPNSVYSSYIKSNFERYKASEKTLSGTEDLIESRKAKKAN